ncbi:MAG: branched-chain amino acid transport system ATP-binding protein [Methylobacteriaceae bacterium]|jgi:branched-chain amino acid transport system ATP-binding protein|nr:branched-chain amino acid transport system ATP-binding protein [Methylobacteriaceae bacterium]
MPSDSALLRVTELRASYGDAQVLHGVSLEVTPGDFVCIIGANTAGKSTLLRAISRLVPRVSGRIEFDGNNLLALSAQEVPRVGIAHVPEGRHVFPDMSVEDNLLIGAFARRRDGDMEARLDEVFALFPRLRERRAQRGGSMSGGEQQMVAIGRALMLRPRLLMLDEPSHGLAPMVVEELHRTLREIHARGTAILLVEQNSALALSLATRGIVLESGRIALAGSADTLRNDPRVREAYLGI